MHHMQQQFNAQQHGYPQPQHGYAPQPGYPPPQPGYPAPQQGYAPQPGYVQPPAYAQPGYMPQPAYSFQQQQQAQAAPKAGTYELPSLEELYMEYGTAQPQQGRGNAVPADVLMAKNPLYGAQAQYYAQANGMQYANGYDYEQPPAAEEPQEKTGFMGNKIGHFAFNALFYLIVIAILAGSAIFAFSNDPQKSYFGYRLYTVKTPSMTPREDGSSPPGGFRAGDSILVRVTNDPSTIQVGDIVTFVPGRDPDVYLTHRVVQRLDRLNDDEGLFFVTRGDANDADDSPIKAEAIVGTVVFSIPAVGGFLQFVRTNLALSIMIIGSAMALIILLRMYFKLPKSKKKITEEMTAYAQLQLV